MNKDTRKYHYQFFIRCGFFNPFKKRDPNTIIPVFNFLPQFGIGLGRSTGTITLHIGWLNFEFFMSLWLIKLSYQK